MARALPALALRERLRGFWLNRLPRTDALRLTQRSDYASFITRHGNSVDALLTAMREQLAQQG